jgi:glycosyl transferase family 25
MLIKDFFDRIYIVNLLERTDRAKHMAHQISKLGLAFDSTQVELFPAVKPQNSDPFPSVGAKGCFLSHLQILRKAHKEGLSNILILEDDADFLPDLLIYEEKIVNQLIVKTWDIAQLGYYHPTNETLPTSLTDPSPTDRGSLVKYTGPTRCSHCVAVSEQGLSSLVKFFEAMLDRPKGHPQGGPMHVDGAYNIFVKSGSIRLLSTPAVVVQTSSRSDITPSRYDQVPILSFILGKLRETGLTRTTKRILRNFSL